jgi:hypothetical protein
MIPNPHFLGGFSRKALHSLTVEGDESCPVSTLRDNAICCYHPATSIARTRSSLRCDVIGGCKRNQHRQKLPGSKLNDGSHASTTNQTKNRQKPYVAHRQEPDEEKEKKSRSRPGLCSHNTNHTPEITRHKSHTATTTTATATTAISWAQILRPSFLRSTTATSIITRAPATPTPCYSLSSLRDRK